MLLVLLTPGSSRVEAGGRSKPEFADDTKPSPSILVNSWYRDKMIQVALANIAPDARRVSVAIGTEDVQSELFASQSLSIPARSIVVVYFPRLKKKTAKGVVKDSDHVSVYASEGPLIDLQPVQEADLSPAQMNLENFLAASGDGITVSYDPGSGPDLRLVFVPKALRVQEQALIPGRPRQGSLSACSGEDLNKLELPDDYRRQAHARLSDHYGYIVKPGEKARISVDYSVPEIADCAVVRISDYQYSFSPAGGVSQGGGPVATVMVYNPAVMKIAPLFPLIPEGNEDGKLKKR